MNGRRDGTKEQSCIKPNTESELVIRHDCEDTLYCFDFSDFENRLVKLVGDRICD